MTTSPAASLIDRITADMQQAMKNKQLTERDELKTILARISNAEAVNQARPNHNNLNSPVAGAVKGVGSTEAQRRTLSAADIALVLLDEQQEIKAALAYIDDDSEYAATLRAKLAVVQKYIMSGA